MARGYSYSPSPPPRGYRGRGRERSPSPRGDRYGAQGRDIPTSLLVRNLRRDCRPDDLRRPFGQFGRLKDVYIPRDYHTQEPRGFGFVQYFDPADAADAKYYMDGQVVLGREIAVVFAQENRKKPGEMRTRESSRGHSRGRSYDRRYSPSPRGRPSYRGRSYSRSPSPRYSRRRFREESYSRSPADSGSRSPTPSDGRYGRSARRERSVSVSE
ncbi:serine/arginine-rich SC35-like splicing factor SCL30A isoform X1 [Lolium rigidum]|uniref:serine/arginine-rich SC35-like splicing factor SCL30A isoform X1 n=1 Tax=Lolium rigidum TaxID=89674 RepID=UPI001F5D57E9|nr:serine/arginine-rich SC35-like splicing factor SCL30A isoform X1 [Lolium rigidum]